MFESLSSRLGNTLRALSGSGRLTEDDVKNASRDLRMALLEADVALPVVRDFVERVRARAVGTEVTQSLTPGQAFLRIVQQDQRLAGGNDIAFLNQDFTNDTAFQVLDR